MNKIYKFVAGNSRVTPIGIALAAVLALELHETLGGWTPVLYVAVLLLTLAASTAEPPV